MQAPLSGPLGSFIAESLLVVGLSRVFGIGARALRQPMVIAEIVAGIAVGPSLLGRVWPGARSLIFPAKSVATLGLVSQLGLVLFMFLVGLDFDPRLLRGRGRASVAISHASIAAPFGLGVLLAYPLHSRLSNPALPFAPFALFMGVAMSITAFPVLARILAERRLLQTQLGATALACAAIGDVTAWCILAFVLATVRVGGIRSAALTTTLAALYVTGMMVFVRPLLRRLAVHAARNGGPTENQAALLLLLALASAWATEIIGVHALFGAFALGAATPNNAGFANAIGSRLEQIVVVLFLPLFFAYSGLRTEIGLLHMPADWAICVIITVVASLGKFGGGALTARLTGMSFRDASALGILMNTRGLMELIVLNIGLDLGVISAKLFAMMVLMALVTTFMTSPLLRWIYPMPAEPLGAALSRRRRTRALQRVA